jgi:mono/diheme cytochrome c family protein
VKAPLSRSRVVRAEHHRETEGTPAARASLFALLTCAWMAVALSSVQSAPAPVQSGRVPAGPDAAKAVLEKYCTTCHNQRLRTAGLVLDAVDITSPSAAAEVWERVIKRLQTGSMPPAGLPRPDLATSHAVASWLETEIDRAAAANPNPGRTSPVHRLNRTEYRNAVRDLLALDTDVASWLPGDETSDSGFDNNGDVLSITTAQLERYMSAARKITRLATGLVSPGGYQTFEVPLFLLQDDRVSEDLPFGSRGGAAVRHLFPADGEYLVKVRLRTNWQDYILGMGTPHQLDVRVDGKLIKRFTVGGEAPGTPAPTTFTVAEPGGPEWERYMREADAGLEVRAAIEAGPHVVGVSFVRDMWEPEGIFQPRQAGEVLSNDESYHGRAAVEAVEIGGPYRITGSGDTPSRRRIFICQPSRRGDEEACATRILSRLARLAFRRPITTADVRMLLGFFEAGRTRGGSFEAGIQLALERMLVDPDFLLRIQREPAGAAPGRPYRIDAVELASRLSFFLWSSIPDGVLLDLAESGKLTEPAVLRGQVRRMLADERASSLVDNFATQWLHLRNLADVVGDPVVFPDFDANLVDAFRRETELFIASTLSDDRSVVELLSADYTFVNERLARHYGIPGVYGNRFRRVTLPDMRQRGGLLAHGGLLALTSYPTRTSPVLRGKWLLDTILGAPPPSPPPNVPPLPERDEQGRTASVRERLEQHRRNPACATCHAIIDPPGFALENFDGLGAWRTADETGNPIDAAATLPGGFEVGGLAGLRALLLDRRAQFAHTVTEKLLAYALGRGLDYHDQPTVRAIVRDAASGDYRWSALIGGVVESPAFLMRTARAVD